MRADIIIIGAGMAGASIAAELAGAGSILLLEAESLPGYHSTGRSAAFWSETYGGPAVQPLTSASGAYLRDGGFLVPRRALHLAGADGGAALDAMAQDFEGSGVALAPVDRAGIAALVPGVRPGHDRALLEPSCCDIDVAGLHAHYLARARKGGVRLFCDARVQDAARVDGMWVVQTAAGQFAAPVLINAAGAWASGIARMAGAQDIAITPYRRTVIQLAIDPAAAADLPLVIDAEERFYFKPEAGGRLWLSPHDETPVPASDVAPEELDIAIAIDRLAQAVDWKILRRERAWAGLRSFAPDRAPVYGWDRRAPGFFWFAGQGGFGIQTAPAAAMIGAALVRRGDMPDAVRGMDVGRYGPERFG